MPPPHLAKWSEAQGLVFVSGQFEAQTAQALANLDIVSNDAGLDRSCVVKTNVWIRTAGDFAGFDAAYANFFGHHRPARSPVVCDLVAPKAPMEIEAVAARRS